MAVALNQRLFALTDQISCRPHDRGGEHSFSASILSLQVGQKAIIFNYRVLLDSPESSQRSL